jgi:hypothetical protein
MTARLQSLFVAGVLVTMPLAAFSDREANRFDAELNGYNEIPTLSSPARAEFDAKINRAETEIEYAVTYSGFPTPVQQAHLHLGKRAFNGGIMVFICSNLGNGPAGTPPCPLNAGTVTGTWNAASVVGPAAQGIAAGEFAEVIAAIRAGAAYANIHTQAFPAGEIRDQLGAKRGHDH